MSAGLADAVSALENPLPTANLSPTTVGSVKPTLDTTTTLRILRPRRQRDHGSTLQGRLQAEGRNLKQGVDVGRLAQVIVELAQVTGRQSNARTPSRCSASSPEQGDELVASG